MLKLPREAIFIRDKLSSAAGTNIVHHVSSFDKQGEGGGLKQHLNIFVCHLQGASCPQGL